MALSPACTVNSSATPADVAGNSTVNVALANSAGVLFWGLQIISADELTNVATVQASLSINQTNKTATFTAPSSPGSCVIVQSTVGIGNTSKQGSGTDASNQVQATYTTTFKVNVKTSGGLRVLALNEVFEQGPNGWTMMLNAAIRAVAAATLAVSGSGLVHQTSGATDASAYLGSAGQLLFTNAAASDTSWASASGDVSVATSPLGKFTVVGIRGNSVPSPSGSNTVLAWSGSAFSWSAAAAGGALTAFGADLAGSTATNQWVAAISGSGGNGGTVAVNATLLQFAAGQTSAGVGQAAATTDVSPANFVLTPQSAWASATTIAHATPGSFVVALGSPQSGGYGTGNEAYLTVTRAASTKVQIGWSAGGSVAGIWFQNVTPSNSNIALGGDGSANTVLNVPTGGTVALQVNGSAQVAITTTDVVLEPPILAFDGGVVGATIGQLGTSSVTQGANLTLSPQQSTQATNFGGGSLIVALQTPGGSGKDAYLQVNVGSNAYAAIGHLTNSLAVYGALYLGEGISPAGTNYTVVSDGTSGFFNAPSSGGSVYLSCGNVSQVTVTTSAVSLAPSILTWSSTTPAIQPPAAATVLQVGWFANVTTGATGAPLELQPQFSTNAASTGGNLQVLLQSGVTAPSYMTFGFASTYNGPFTTTGWIGLGPSASGFALYGASPATASNVGLLLGSNYTNVNAPTSGGALGLQVNESTIISIQSTAIIPQIAAFTWPATVTAPTISQSAPITDSATTSLLIEAQAAYSLASTNINGGMLWLSGGNSKSSGVTGLGGGVSISIDYNNSRVVAQAVEPVVGQRVFALAKGGYTTSTQMPSGSGDLVIFIANANTVPTASAVGGGILYVTAGALKYRGSSGTVTNLGSA